MLNENAIDKLIQPLIDRQEQINMTALLKMAKHIKKINTLAPSDVHKLERMLKTGSDVREINKRISELAKLQEKEIKKIIKTVAQDAYKDAKPYYDYRQLPYIPFGENKELQTAIEAVRRVTLEDYTNLSNSMAFMWRDPINPLIVKPTSIAETYQKIVDLAIQSVTTGIESYNTTIPKALQQLIDSGGLKMIDGTHKVEYTTDKGKVHYVRADTVVRRNILDGIRNVHQTVQQITGEQFGSDGIELSVHNFSAPDHEPIQGHQFTNEQFFERLQVGEAFEDVNGRRFIAIKRPIGVWNCHHFYFCIVIGAIPAHTEKELKEIIAANNKGYTYINGRGEKKHLTMYECLQKRNGYELDLRKLKEGKEVADTAGQTELAEKYQAKIYQKQNHYEAFCRACGLETRYDKTVVYTADSVIKSTDIAEKSLTDGRKDGIINLGSEGMYRKSKPNRVEPMPKKQLHRIEKSFKKQGGTIQYSKEIDDYLESKNAEAITYDSTTILLKTNAGRASVFEELIYATQYRNGSNDGSYLSRLKCEIEAQKKLLKNSNAYKLTDIEIEQTKNALAEYEKELKAYNKTGGA